MTRIEQTDSETKYGPKLKEQMRKEVEEDQPKQEKSEVNAVKRMPKPPKEMI